MLAGETKPPFSGKDWIFEIKWDGYRAIAECRGKQSRLYSRNAISFSEDYPSIYKAVQDIRTPMVLDGEIVVLDEHGKPDFQKLQHYEDSSSLPIVYYVFDILNYKGKDVGNKPLTERKALLQKVLPQSDSIRYCDHIEEDGENFFAEMQKQNMEGMIAKKKNSLYLPGERNKSWVKVKHQLIDEAVICGFTKPGGGRKYFGSLVLGQYRNGKLIYVGHTGTGFSNQTLKELHRDMMSLGQDENPFGARVPVNNAVTWLQPQLVANIHYAQLTQGGIMRHPVFHGLRIDKTITDMKGETGKAVAQEPADKDGNAHSNIITVDKVELSLSNVDKIFFPQDGYTKGDIILYYSEVASYILPYLKDRPHSMRRNPNGISDKGFFQKDMGSTAPAWAKTTSIYSDSNKKEIEYLLCNNKATLLYMANLGCIELNPWNSKANTEDNPDYLILDLDPSDKNSFDDVIEAAGIVKKILDKAGANCYCKTSGASGLHIYVPLGAKYSYEEARLFAELVAHLTVEKAPGLATIERSIAARKGKLYLDYLQNKKGQTLASAYSVRPKLGATISTPLEWKEVKKGLHPSLFTIKNIIKRIEKKGDLFTGVLGKGINLKTCLKKIETL